MEPIEITLLILLFSVIVGLITYAAIKSKHKNFVILHSVPLKNQKAINAKFQFLGYPDLDWSHRYDNESIYECITAHDYLTLSINLL